MAARISYLIVVVLTILVGISARFGARWIGY